MHRNAGTVPERQLPSGELRNFLDPLNPGVYFDHGPARLYGIDEVLEFEAARRGRSLGDDEFQLVATDGGLIFCRASICFAIAARWRDLTLSRPEAHDDDFGRMDLPVEWPGHGLLAFTVSQRLGSNVYRRWLHMQSEAGRRSHAADVAESEQFEGVEYPDPEVIEDESAESAVAGWSDSVAEEWSEYPTDGWPNGDPSLPVDDQGSDGWADPGTWTEPEVELAGGETLFVEPERSGWSGQIDAYKTVDPSELVQSERVQSERVPSELVSSELAPNSPPGAFDDLITGEDFDPNRTFRSPRSLGEVVGAENWPVGGEPLGGESLGDDSAVGASVFGIETPAAASFRNASIGPGIHDSGYSADEFRRAGQGQSARSATKSASGLRLGTSRSARAQESFKRGRGGKSPADADTTLSEVWHRNRVSILAGASLVVLLVIALSSILDGSDNTGIEAGADADQENAGITIPARSGTISLPADAEMPSTSTIEPNSPLVIEGLTTTPAGSSSGVGTTDGTGGEVAVADIEQTEDVAVCHSNYGGCVPVAADVDCVGDGDGPAFLGEPVVVFGEDVYDLDTDDDREACELGQPLSTPPDGS